MTTGCNGTPVSVESPSTAAASTTSAAPIDPNVLLLIIDDLGVESAECYAAGDAAAPMPRLASLCRQGVVFEQAWSYPSCSPTRAAMLTGRYGFRTGVGAAVSPQDLGLGPDEVTLPLVLASHGVPSAGIGKWHLSGTAIGDDALVHPARAGFDHYSGSPRGALQDYENWRRVVDGIPARETGYATSVAVDDALAWIEQQDGPWFSWIGFNAPHTPFHLPPNHLHTRSDLPGSDADIGARPREYFEAAIESLDTEIGRLLDTLGPEVLRNTYVVVIGDNGTPARVANVDDRRRAKGSLYAGGLHVPLIVVGPGIEPSRSNALVSVVDIFPTVVDWFGGPVPSAIDGISFANAAAGGSGERTYLLAESFGVEVTPERTGQTLSDGTWKYLAFADGIRELYNLENDPSESADLMSDPGAAAARGRLERALETLNDRRLP